MVARYGLGATHPPGNGHWFNTISTVTDLVRYYDMLLSGSGGLPPEQAKIILGDLASSTPTAPDGMVPGGVYPQRFTGTENHLVEAYINDVATSDVQIIVMDPDTLRRAPAVHPGPTALADLLKLAVEQAKQHLFSAVRPMEQTDQPVLLRRVDQLHVVAAFASTLVARLGQHRLTDHKWQGVPQTAAQARAHRYRVDPARFKDLGGGVAHLHPAIDDFIDLGPDRFGPLVKLRTLARGLQPEPDVTLQDIQVARLPGGAGQLPVEADVLELRGEHLAV